MKKNHRGRRMPYFFGQAATLALAFSMSAPMSAEEAGLLHFDMPAQSLDDALAELADRSGLKLLYRTDWVLGRKIRPLAGDYTPKQALEIMLEHSGLNYRFTDERSVTLEKEHQTGMDGLMKWVASNDYRVDFAANTDEEAYTGPVEQVDMTVQGEEWNSYNVPNSSSATRTNSLLLQTPMSIQVLPRALLDDQQTITIAESLRNVSGVVPRTPFVTPNFEPTLIRGFSAQQLIDGFTQYLNAGDQGSMVNIERIEVIKGANAVLYAGGNGSPVGGVVNLVSKLPKPEAFYEVGVKSGLYDFAQPYVDLNRPINDNVLFRFTGEYT
ncbi:MAG: TonB-dependent siderophore receptor, partial [Gammaproteobacteria bacterium]